MLRKRRCHEKPVLVSYKTIWMGVGPNGDLGRLVCHVYVPRDSCSGIHIDPFAPDVRVGLQLLLPWQLQFLELLRGRRVSHHASVGAKTLIALSMRPQIYLKRT